MTSTKNPMTEEELKKEIENILHRNYQITLNEDMVVNPDVAISEIITLIAKVRVEDKEKALRAVGRNADLVITDKLKANMPKDADKFLTAGYGIAKKEVFEAIHKAFGEEKV